MPALDLIYLTKTPEQDVFAPLTLGVNLKNTSRTFTEMVPAIAEITIIGIYRHL